VVWVSPIARSEGRRLALTECPVSYVTGESAAWLEDFCAHLLVPSSVNVLDWAARRVDAFAVLSSELQEAEKNEHA
jgi:hypothetical protein